MKFDLDRQQPGRSVLAVKERLHSGAPEPLPAEIELDGQLTVDNLEGRVVLLGVLRGAAPAICDRCLDDFTCRFTAEVEIIVLRNVSAVGESETGVIHQRRGEVDLTEPLREAALLGLPQKMLCDEDCRGICPRCGTNRNREACGCAEEVGDPQGEEPTEL